MIGRRRRVLLPYSRWPGNSWALSQNLDSSPRAIFAHFIPRFFSNRHLPEPFLQRHKSDSTFRSIRVSTLAKESWFNFPSPRGNLASRALPQCVASKSQRPRLIRIQRSNGSTPLERSINQSRCAEIPLVKSDRDVIEEISRKFHCRLKYARTSNA
jgi:hypothetical protein